MWPDNETADDLIGFRIHVDLIRSIVVDHKILPLTIGIFGDWGGGKTSIMKMLQKDLDPARWPAESDERKAYAKVAVLYFNTWQFEGYDDAKAAIMNSVLMQLAESQRFGPKVRGHVVSLLKSVNWMRTVRLGLEHVAVPAVAAFLMSGAGAIPAATAALAAASISRESAGTAGTGAEAAPEGGAATDWNEFIKKETPSTDALDLRNFRDRFGKMLADSDITSLVVLVDDLDRCTPDRIIDNLEAIKLFLNAEHTAFVIGADPRIVQHAIRARYAERAVDNPLDEEAKNLVKDYLEKLIQVPYRLPRLSASEIETYMSLLFCQRHLTDSDFRTCLKFCVAGRQYNRYSSFGYAGVKEALKHQELDAELSEALSLCAAAAPLIADGLKGNPRQVKRFLNALLLRKQLAQMARLHNMRNDVLIKLMILEYANEKRFFQLFAWQSEQDGYPTQIVSLEAAVASPEDTDGDEVVKKMDAEWTSPKLKKWVAMEPRLKDVDLRDYFWIARDRLESTFSGLSMVPPIVRTILDGLLSANVPKRQNALKMAAEIREEERHALLTLIEQQITRQPYEKAGYGALRALADASIAGSAELLGSILMTRPPEKMPPSVGQDVMTLLKAKPELAVHLSPAIERLRNTNSKIGTSIKHAK